MLEHKTEMQLTYYRSLFQLIDKTEGIKASYIYHIGVCGQ